MAVGKSHRIVIEVDPDFKEKTYEALRSRGLTLKEWFLEEVRRDLLSEESVSEPNSKEESE